MGLLNKEPFKSRLANKNPNALVTKPSFLNSLLKVQEAAKARQAKEAWDAAAPEREAREMAVQTTRVQESNAARAAAEGASRDAISAPAEEGDVLLDDSGDTAGGVQAKRTRKRQTFGVGVTGVNI